MVEYKAGGTKILKLSVTLLRRAVVGDDRPFTSEMRHGTIC